VGIGGLVESVDLGRAGSLAVLGESLGEPPEVPGGGSTARSSAVIAEIGGRDGYGSGSLPARGGRMRVSAGCT
jgi:hypothetical protein